MMPTPDQLATKVGRIAGKRADARVIGFHATGAWTGGETVTAGGAQWPVAVLCSPLEISERLSGLGPGERCVVLTPLSDAELSQDVLARLSGRRLESIDRWGVVREVFSATQIDPRLPKDAWVADALLAAAPEGGYPPVPSGWLDAETAWRAVLRHHLALGAGRPDATDLLRWSLDPAAAARYEGLQEPMRSGIRAYLLDTPGALGAVLLDVLDAGHGADLLPIGVVCQVLFPDGGPRRAALSQAIARLERYLNGRTLGAAEGRAWFQAARGVLDGLPGDRRERCIDRAEGLLAELRAEPFAEHSKLLRSGLQRRLIGFGKALQAALDKPSGNLTAVEEALRGVDTHAGAQPEASERLEMALRLLRWLQAPAREAGPGLGDLVQAYLGDGLYADWARRNLLGSHAIAECARAFGRLHQRVRELREVQNRRFAERLSEWNRAPGPVQGLLPIEHFLEQVLAPIATERPVLLLVLDGMDGSVFQELAEDLGRRAWLRWEAPAGALLAVLPTMTEFSRTALLTGRVGQGASAGEKSGFAAHAALVGASRRGRPPVLFHKGELTDAAAHGLAAPVRQSIASQEQRIVGVVINAVDDHLAKSEQLRARWSVDGLRLLDALLYEAELAGRAVVLTSDHGHVLEESSRRIEGSAGDRWRPYGEPVEEGERVLAGPRIREATGADRVVLLWSEAARYGAKKNGYHGGATPQEVIVPLGLFLGPGQAHEGWNGMPEQTPQWWWASKATGGQTPAPAPRPGRRKGTAPAGQAKLFEPPRAAGASWIQDLLDSPVYQAQQRIAGRAAPREEPLRRALEALVENRQELHERILAQRLGVPAFRLPGMMAGMQRLLNVDGYQVLALRDDTRTVQLNLDLLKKQFQLGD